MLNPKSIKSISDLREDPLGVIKVAEELGEPVIIMHRGKPVGVVMDLAQYDRYCMLIEDHKKDITS